MKGKRARRKVCWGRVFLLLLVLAGLGWGVTKGVAYTYQALLPIEPVPKMAKPASPYVDKMGKRINILLIGVDDEEQPTGMGCTDTVMMLSINPEDHSINLLSIPRDTMITFPGRQAVDKIKNAYSYGGVELAVRTVEHLLQVPITYYVKVDWQGFMKLVDVVGGVELYVDKNMNYEDSDANLTIHLSRGYQHLDGAQAGQYVRYRSDEMGDLGRVQRQQIFMKALAEQLFQFGIVTKLPDLWKSTGQYLETDLNTVAKFKIVYSIRSISNAKLRFDMVPGQSVEVEGQSYWQADPGHTRQVVEEMFYANNGK